MVIDLDSIDLERMKAGMSVKVTSARDLAEGTEDAIVAPRASLDLSDLDSPRVLLADGSWRPVEIGPCTPMECVIAQGLADGEALGRTLNAGEGS